MLLGKAYGEAEEAPGQWFVWKEEGEEKIELQIRPISPADRRRIRSKHLGKKRRMLLANRGVEQEIDSDAQNKARVEMAAYCLQDTRGFTFPPAERLAERLTKLLGHEVPVEKPLTLDGRWSEQVKETMLNSYPIGGQLLDFIDETVTKLLGEEEQEEEQASGN